MGINADIAFVERHLVRTLDKELTLRTLREWRAESKSKDEADVLGDLIYLIDEEGKLDG